MEKMQEILIKIKEQQTTTVTNTHVEKITKEVETKIEVMVEKWIERFIWEYQWGTVRSGVRTVRRRSSDGPGGGAAPNTLQKGLFNKIIQFATFLIFYVK